MAHNCPSCGQRLRWNELSPSFACQQCGKRLTSNAISVFAWVALFVSWPVFAIAAASSEVVAVISLAIGAALSWFIASVFSDVKVARNEDAT